MPGATGIPPPASGNAGTSLSIHLFPLIGPALEDGFLALRVQADVAEEFGN